MGFELAGRNPNRPGSKRKEFLVKESGKAAEARPRHACVTVSNEGPEQAWRAGSGRLAEGLGQPLPEITSQTAGISSCFGAGSDEAVGRACSCGAERRGGDTD